MKRIMFLFLLMSTVTVNAQISENASIVKLGAGYSTDFPGLDGYCITGEFSRYMAPFLQGAFGVKRVDMNGYPRTKDVKEFTKATTLDFTVYFLPLHSEQHIIRIGGSYTFSFFNMRRAYPVLEQQPGSLETITTWPHVEKKGTARGCNLIGEYEYIFPQSKFSMGMRASLFKAYDRVSYLGAFAAVYF